MKYIYTFFGKVSLVFYIFTLYQLWHLCQYGGLKNHTLMLVLGIIVFGVTLLLWLISRRYNQKSDSEDSAKKKISYVEVSLFIIATLFFGGRMVYSAIPYHGALSWKVDEWMREKEIKLEHNNVFESGVEGILTDLDAALGSRFYILEKTVDGGTTWECTNEDPFAGQLGVVEGLLFFDENLGVAGLTGASQSFSALYITRNGGLSFEQIELPMNTVTELPELAKECGFTVEDYDYLNMPERDGDVWMITVTPEAAESDGIVFQSMDDGLTWECSGINQKAN